MTPTLLVEFDDQFSASSANEKLLSQGIAADRIVLQFDERTTAAPSSSPAPTTIIHDTLPDSPGTATGADKRDDEHARAAREAPDTPRTPECTGRATLSIYLSGELEESVIIGLLEQCGATAIHRLDTSPVRPNPAMRPSVDTASAVDVQRAIAASRGGAALRPEDRTRSDPGTQAVAEQRTGQRAN